MFLVEIIAGLLAHSTALLADSVDMLGDAIVTASVCMSSRVGPVWQARGALRKGVIMTAFGTGLLIEVGMKLAGGLVPVAKTMGVIGVLALGAGVALTGQAWPDVVVGLLIALLFMTSAMRVIRDARWHLRRAWRVAPTLTCQVQPATTTWSKPSAYA
jgi:Co/Zn/Cd efflux system component